MHPSAARLVPCLTCFIWFLENNLGRGGDLDGERQGRVGLRAGAGRQDVPGGRAGQVSVRDALRPALLLGAPELERLLDGSDRIHSAACISRAQRTGARSIAGRRS